MYIYKANREHADAISLDVKIVYGLSVGTS